MWQKKKFSEFELNLLQKGIIRSTTFKTKLFLIAEKATLFLRVSTYDDGRSPRN